MILTRSGFPGIQRYGSALWSGDVGNDWETLRRQITGGLGLQATGIPWWTYDAGGFFRPRDQYNSKDYINRMLRWIELSVYLPLMRVHGYMSDTEPWKYGDNAKATIKKCIERRKELFPYIYSNAAEVAFNGSTLMRPLVFDFSNDKKALDQKYEFMFGKSLLVSPVTEPDVTSWKTYLPENKGGWYSVNENYKHYDGGQTVETKIDETDIPVFAKAGSIVVKKGSGDVLDINVFEGDDAEFVLYEDDGESFEYEKGNYSKTLISWKQVPKTLTIKPLGGNWTAKHTFEITKGASVKTINYKGKEMKIKYKN
jgi:alpha-D-xyloside xylohydrolase